jgi:Phosphoserine phosphatase RsbU, N-terminal domain
VTASARFRKAYADALHEHLRSPTEGQLQVAYEIGRSALSDNVSIVEIALVHHELLAESGSASASVDPEAVTWAGQFLSEALAAYEMMARGYHEVRDAVALERRHAAMIRQLATFMGDASLAVHSRDSTRELIRLVAEHARELTDACSATVAVVGPDNRQLVETVDDGPPTAAASSTEERTVALRALDGHEIGTITIIGKPARRFMEIDDAVLAHLGQMASAALERIHRYQRPRGCGR